MFTLIIRCSVFVFACSLDTIRNHQYHELEEFAEAEEKSVAMPVKPQGDGKRKCLVVARIHLKDVQLTSFALQIACGLIAYPAASNRADPKGIGRGTIGLQRILFKLAFKP